MLIFFTGDEAVREEVAGAGLPEARFSGDRKEVLGWLGEVAEGTPCFLFLDFDGKGKEAEKLNSELCGRDGLVRIVLYGEGRVKELKKHQKGEHSANAYICRPLGAEVVKGFLDDFQMADFVFQGRRDQGH